MEWSHVSIVVQKFGGTSVADAYKIHLAARRAIRAKLDGHRVVLVVSAMGKTTDKLVDLAAQVSRHPSKREMDMLLSTGEQVSIALVAMAIHEAGHEAISLTGGQLGMRTDSVHTQARIRSIESDRIKGHLDLGKIVICAGFQGVDEDFNITTLGRGGSDTTAVAIAAALEAQICEIYTDVDGIFTTDPRIVPEARKMDKISYDEMLELASLGAGVMHSRSIEFGKKFGVPIHVRSSLTDNPGTIIMDNPPGMEDVVVRGATLKRDIGCITFVDVENTPGLVASMFEEIAKRSIIVDDIIQTNSHKAEKASLALTVPASDVQEAADIAAVLRQSHPCAELEVSDKLSKVSVVGIGMRSHHGVAAKMFRALAEQDINIENISTSEIVVSAIVPREDADRALQAVHKAFDLDKAEL
jgi:aspartate kinase